MWPQTIPDRGLKLLREKAYAPRLAELGGWPAPRAWSRTMSGGGASRHIAVLAREAIDHLNVRDGGVYVDGTFGAGGCTSAILAAADAKVIAIDRDQSAVAQGMGLVEAAGGRLTVVEGRFSALDAVARKFGHAQ